jgi:L-amino acid N-acyltransferase YncA
MPDRADGEPLALTIEAMTPADWESVRAMYREGIATRNATFETDAPDWETWDRGRLKVARLVARADGQVVGWAALSPVSSRPAYAGVAEVSLYVAASARGRGVGKALLRASIEASERAGVWTLQGAIFPENAASLALVRGCGFREVGRRERIGCLNGVWRDTILVERRSRVVGT